MNQWLKHQRMKESKTGTQERKNQLRRSHTYIKHLPPHQFRKRSKCKKKNIRSPILSRVPVRYSLLLSGFTSSIYIACNLTCSRPFVPQLESCLAERLFFSPPPSKRFTTKDSDVTLGGFFPGEARPQACLLLSI
jgi:hypothetical protein